MDYNSVISFFSISTMILITTTVFFGYLAKDYKEELDEVFEENREAAGVRIDLRKAQEYVKTLETGVELRNAKIQELLNELVEERAKNFSLENELDITTHEMLTSAEDYIQMIKDTQEAVYYDQVNDVVVIASDLVKLGRINGR